MDEKTVPGIEPIPMLSETAEGGRDVCCTICGVREWVFPLDVPLDDLFVANYFCEDCEETK